MPTANVKIHTNARIKRRDFFKFHLSVKNKQAAIYTKDSPEVIASPSIANEVKSTASKRSNTADQSTFGRYNITVANPTGNTHAKATKRNNSGNIMLLNGTKMQLSNNAQPDT